MARMRSTHVGVGFPSAISAPANRNATRATRAARSACPVCIKSASHSISSCMACFVTRRRRFASSRASRSSRTWLQATEPRSPHSGQLTPLPRAREPCHNAPVPTQTGHWIRADVRREIIVTDSRLLLIVNRQASWTGGTLFTWLNGGSSCCAHSVRECATFAKTKAGLRKSSRIAPGSTGPTSRASKRGCEILQ